MTTAPLGLDQLEDLRQDLGAGIDLDVRVTGAQIPPGGVLDSLAEAEAPEGGEDPVSFGGQPELQ